MYRPLIRGTFVFAHCWCSLSTLNVFLVLIYYFVWGLPPDSCGYFSWFATECRGQQLEAKAAGGVL